MRFVYRVRYLEIKKMNHNSIISEYYFTTKREATKFRESLHPTQFADVTEQYVHDNHKMALEHQADLEKMKLN